MSESLSKRCLEILEKTAEGKTTQETAKDLFVSPETIKTFKKIIISKMNARNMTNAVAIGIRKGYIK